MIDNEAKPTSRQSRAASASPLLSESLKLDARLRLIHPGTIIAHPRQGDPSSTGLILKVLEYSFSSDALKTAWRRANSKTFLASGQNQRNFSSRTTTGDWYAPQAPPLPPK